jgi:hypothetical protein
VKEDTMGLFAMKASLFAAVVLASGLCLSGGAAGNNLAGDTRLQTMIGLPADELDAMGIPAQQTVFSQECDWVAFWKAHSKAPAPLVDFARWQIVAVFLGPKPNPGYGLRIPYAQKVLHEQTTYVYYEEVKPRPGGVYAQVIVYPYEILAVPSAPQIKVKPTRFTAPEPSSSRTVAAQTLPTAALQQPKQSLYRAFLDSESWKAFWKANAASAPPAVDFDHDIVVGLLQPQGAPAVSLSRVEEQGGITRVKLIRGLADECTSLLIVIPRAARVDFGWVESQL